MALYHYEMIRRIWKAATVHQSPDGRSAITLCFESDDEMGAFRDLMIETADALQTIQGRDLIKALRLKTPKKITNHQITRWEFVDRSFPKDNATSAPFIRGGNALAHGLNPKNIYGSLMNPKIRDVIREDLSAAAKSSSDREFITLVTGVPLQLLEHSLSTFEYSTSLI